MTRLSYARLWFSLSFSSFCHRIFFPPHPRNICVRHRQNVAENKRQLLEKAASRNQHLEQTTTVSSVIIEKLSCTQVTDLSQPTGSPQPALSVLKPLYEDLKSQMLINIQREK